jgi:hypothetical protein
VGADDGVADVSGEALAVAVAGEASQPEEAA